MEPEVSADSFDKDVEIQSLHSPSSTTVRSEDSKKDVKKGDGGSVSEDQDIEEYPESMDQACCVENGNEKSKGRSLKDVITRTSTKSSWKDPGPPPDGGLSGWTQGTWIWFH